MNISSLILNLRGLAPNLAISSEIRPDLDSLTDAKVGEPFLLCIRVHYIYEGQLLNEVNYLGDVDDPVSCLNSEMGWVMILETLETLPAHVPNRNTAITFTKENRP